MEIFKLFGSILVDSDEANKSIAKTSDKADGLGGKLSDGIKTAAKWGAGLALAAGSVAIALGTTAFNASEDLHKALNGLQSSTGVTTEMMGGMKQSMLDIYNNNFGESFEDIGKSMATIQQQTGLNGTALGDLTKTALALRDTFEFEVNESVRSANMLMTQFGLDGNAAYNLIAQGAQWGLDKNGDLLDTINEYSVHFKQMGFDSEQMFNMLANGAASGTFSVDKLGDAVKEFGIRSKDGSKASSEAFAALGLDATTMTANFAAGGESANQAFTLVTKKLLEMKDPVAQNTAGVGLFGTMWEDLGVKGITAITDVNGEIGNHVKALEAINAVKYDTFGEAVSGIGRQLQTGILIPLGEKILPKLNEFATWIQANMPLIIQKFVEVANAVVKFKDDTIALMAKLTPFFAGIGAGAAVFGLYSLAINASAIATGIWTTVTGIATAAGTAFGAVLAFITSPIGIVVIAIGALVAAGVALYQNWDTVKAFLNTTWTWIKDTAVMIFNSILEFFKNYGLLLLGIITGPAGWSVLIASAIIKNWDVIKAKTIEIFESIKQWIAEKLTAIKDIFINSVESFKQVGKDIFTGVWDGIKDIWNGISNWVSEKVSWLVDKLAFWRSSQSTMGGGTFNGVPIKARAVGGSINAGETYLVGEKGPELFTSNQSGSIIPNHKLATAGTGINITITGNTIMGDADADRFGDLIVRRLKSLGVT